jgi:hypothetical protein
MNPTDKVFAQVPHTPGDGPVQVYPAASFDKGRPVIEVFGSEGRREAWIEGAETHSKAETYTARIPEDVDDVPDRHLKNLEYAIDDLDMELTFEEAS